MKRLFITLAAAAVLGFSLNAADKPGYPGGDSALNQYIKANLKYPSYAMENGVEGVVTIGFVVAPDGSLSNLKVMKMVDPDLESEAMRLVEGMPKWIPAEKDGTPVEAPSQVNIPFILE